MRRMVWTSCVIILLSTVPRSDAAESQMYRTQSYQRLQITFTEAIEGHDIKLMLGIHDGVALQAWGEIPQNQKLIKVFDNEKLSLKNGRLTGRLRCWIDLDEHEHPCICLLDLDAMIDSGGVTGRFESCSSVLTDTLIYETDELVVEPRQVSLFHYGQRLEGKVSSRFTAPARPEAASFTLWTMHALKGVSSWQRYVTFEAAFADGKSTEVYARPTNGARAGWNAEILNHALSFDGEKLAGTITAKVATPDTAGIAPGVYHFTLDGTADNNALLGTIHTTLGEEKYPADQAFSGIGYSPLQMRRDPRVLEITIERGIEGKNDLCAHVLHEGGKARDTVAFHPGHPEHWEARYTTGDEQSQLDVTYPENTPLTSRRDALDVTYIFDANESEYDPEGTFRCVFGKYSRASGRITGVVADIEAIADSEAVRKDFEWPCWNGPFSCFAAAPSGHRLVNRLDQARLVWKSEHTFPARCQTTRYGENNIRKWIAAGGAASGGNSPIIADGRVFFSYFRPAPGPFNETYVQDEIAAGRHVMPIMFATNGVDVALCIDAATGQTVWRKDIPGGRYFAMDGRQGSTKGWYTTNPAAADGRLYFGTTTDVEYCVDAATGQTIWKRTLGETSGRLIVGDVMVRTESDLTGYEASTGRTRWTIQEAGAPYALPLRWLHGEKPYIIVGNPMGEIRLVDPVDGTVRWKLEDIGTNNMTMSARDEFLLCNGKHEDKKPGALTCFRINVDGAKRLWTITSDVLQYRPMAAPVAITDGHAFVRSREPDGLVVVELSSGRIVARQRYDLSASGYVEIADGRALLQVDASHGPTDLLWYNIANPAASQQLGDVWPTRHQTTASYYPILISHAIADGRIFIRGARGIFCYDLRVP